MKRLSIIVMLLLLTIFSNVSAKELAPYKNDLFKYP